MRDTVKNYIAEAIDQQINRLKEDIAELEREKRRILSGETSARPPAKRMEKKTEGATRRAKFIPL